MSKNKIIYKNLTLKFMVYRFLLLGIDNTFVNVKLFHNLVLNFDIEELTGHFVTVM